MLFSIVGESAFVCTEKETGKQTVHLHCPFGTEIQIKESIYGRNKWRQCLYTVGDCTETADLSEECCGRRNCNVTVWRIYSIKCEYVTFFRVIYECVESKYMYFHLVFYFSLKTNIKCTGGFRSAKKLFCF